MTHAQREMISGSVLGLVGVGMYAYASTMPVRVGQPPAVSAGYFPKLLGLALAALAMAQVLIAVREARRVRAVGDGVAKSTAPLWKDRKSVDLTLFTLGLLVLYPILLSMLGFAVTGFIFVGSMIFALTPQSKWRTDLRTIILVTLAITVVTYVVFRLVLKVPFPADALLL